ncbi:MAG: hypothetical protein P4L64_17210 [Caulobacteraceae bacterium]|nr:hypothetical protein [Caulobacteraceae bacterium]
MSGTARYWKWGGLALAVVLIGGGAWAYGKAAPYAKIGGSYIAKQYCSCLFDAGRSETSCRAEFQPDIEKFSLSVDRSGLPAHARVTTHVAVFSGEADYAEGYGCTVGK